ncbi:MAG: hypothetical protein A3F78_18930 [Burkholderiales bacterium RIFCSPLOWO2_12_FULL_61_40]|nr:MAG: hypothetical protein A3F78_18930 [Burkholderiales bacterium RIFCSPLOWO2_12_FULL_61_40]
MLAALAVESALGQTVPGTPDTEDAALMLADQATTATERAKDWQLSVEGAFGETGQRYGKGQLQHQRLSLDLQIDTAFSEGWRAVLSNQLDQRWQYQFSDASSTNTLKEAYLSWQPSPQRALDVGRINARYGVASGYNPTDYFRSGANRSIVAIDPASLKKNRQGSVMLRGQALWGGGSLTAIASPHLADQPSDAAFSLDLGATNRQDRWLLALSQPLGETLTPQWLLYGENTQAPQLGFNLTGVLGQATVAYVEWSGGRSASQLAQALQGADDSAFRARWATGLTYTTANKLSFTVEYDFNGAAPDAQAWDTLGQQAPQAYAQYRAWAQNQMELPTRQSLFLYASWQDTLVNQLDFNAMLRHNLDDHSQLAWLEARYHWSHTDLALQWQRHSGKPGSEFGALQQEQVVQVLLRHFY